MKFINRVKERLERLKLGGKLIVEEENIVFVEYSVYIIHNVLCM